MTLPIDNSERKKLPVWDFLMEYFPDAFLEMVRVSVDGNKQHNPGERLHWAREKSTDQLNTALRHQIDYGTGVHYDVDGRHHLAKAAWRLLAQVQLDLEAAGPLMTAHWDLQAAAAAGSALKQALAEQAVACAPLENTHKMCGKRIPGGRFAWCELNTGHDGPCWTTLGTPASSS